MTDNYDLFEHCKKEDPRAQRILYDLFKGKLMGLCRRYTRNREEAQDILQESFVRIFTKINQLESPEKLESWMKAIAVRTAITYYHKSKTHNMLFSAMPADVINAQDPGIENLSDEYLVNLVNQLPDGCRLVFNMVAVEGYSHSEVAELLQVSEGTSRSQLYHAKLLLKEKLKCQNLAHYYEKFA
jgi:RNA polymerase sigma-70 factor (ECF subfamily)